MSDPGYRAEHLIIPGLKHFVLETLEPAIGMLTGYERQNPRGEEQVLQIATWVCAVLRGARRRDARAQIRRRPRGRVLHLREARSRPARRRHGALPDAGDVDDGAAGFGRRALPHARRQGDRRSRRRVPHRRNEERDGVALRPARPTRLRLGEIEGTLRRCDRDYAHTYLLFTVDGDDEGADDVLIDPSWKHQLLVPEWMEERHFKAAQARDSCAILRNAAQLCACERAPHRGRRASSTTCPTPSSAHPPSSRPSSRSPNFGGRCTRSGARRATTRRPFAASTACTTPSSMICISSVVGRTFGLWTTPTPTRSSARALSIVSSRRRTGWRRQRRRRRAGAIRRSEAIEKCADHPRAQFWRDPARPRSSRDDLCPPDAAAMRAPRRLRGVLQPAGSRSSRCSDPSSRRHGCAPPSG